MSEDTRTAPWSDPSWLAEAHTWIRAELERQGIALTGPIAQVHQRPWSTVLKAATGEGDVYFKATLPVLAHEPAVTQALYGWRPDCMPPVLAVDSTRGWLLMRDCGVTLRSLMQGIGDLYRWREVLPMFARLQIEMIPRADELLALGAPDRRLAQLPALYQQLVDDATFLRLDQPDGLTAQEYQQARALAPRVTALCKELATGGIPATLHHDDFHDGNIFVRDGRYIFTDWGEAFVAHPFCSMVVALRSIASTLKMEADDPALTVLRNLYLEPWADFTSPDRLHKIFSLAHRLGMVCRTLTWYRVVSTFDEPEKSKHVENVTGWLKEVLETMRT